MHATKPKVYTNDPDNRESITSVECISTGGFAIDLMLVMSGKVHIEKSFQNDLNAGTLIGLSDTGYSNEVLGIHWLKHFDIQTFSCRQGAWRLLFDGHVSHLGFEFISYCESVKIIPFCLPPHSTHLLQPLDITVFQPFKHYHSCAVEDAVRNGDIEFSKTTFLAAFQTIHNKTFQKTTILSAWKNASLFPFNPSIVINKMKVLEPLPRTPSPVSDISFSSYTHTPTTYQFTKHHTHVKKRLQNALCLELPLSPSLATSTYKLLKGLEVELLNGQLAIKELERRKKEEMQKIAMKNGSRRIVQSGGVISVGDARIRIGTESDVEMAEKALK